MKISLNNPGGIYRLPAKTHLFVLYGRGHPPRHTAGKCEIVQEGTDITVVAVAYSRCIVLKALELTYASVELIDPRTVDPLDMPLILESLAKTGRLLVVQEAPAECGIGAEIVRRAIQEGFDYFDCPPVVLGGKNIPTPFSAPLEDHILPQPKEIAETITAFAQYKI